MTVVMLTGASGFRGIHILERLLDEGHQVRAFVRTPAKLRQNLALLGVDPDDPRIDVVAGDMTDAAAAREAASGCNQAIHAAATFSYRRRDAERMRRENKVGTTTVLDAAIEAGCTGIVHVSSTAALLRPAATLGPSSRMRSRGPGSSPSTLELTIPRRLRTSESADAHWRSPYGTSCAGSRRPATSKAAPPANVA